MKQARKKAIERESLKQEKIFHFLPQLSHKRTRKPTKAWTFETILSPNELKIKKKIQPLNFGGVLYRNVIDALRTQTALKTPYNFPYIVSISKVLETSDRARCQVHKTSIAAVKSQESARLSAINFDSLEIAKAAMRERAKTPGARIPEVCVHFWRSSCI